MLQGRGQGGGALWTSVDAASSIKPRAGGMVGGTDQEGVTHKADRHVYTC